MKCLSVPALFPAVLFVATVTVAILMLPACGAESPPTVTIDSLDAWVQFSRRPGFELLDKKDLDDYFIAVYRTEAGELAFCYRWRGEGDAPGTSLAVRNEHGKHLREGALSDETTALNPTGPLPAGGFVDGMVFPIRKEFAGPVMLDFRDSVGERDSVPAREVYRKTLPWSP